MTHRRTITRCRFVLVAALSLLAAAGTAQPLEPEADEEANGRVHGNLGGRLGFARMAEDWYLTIAPTLHLAIEDVALTRDSPLFDEPQVHPLLLHFEVPLFVRLHDDPPAEAGTRFRRELWDEPAEYARVLRWMQYGAPYDGIYLRGGELSDTRIGHRSIVDAYANSLDVDHFRWGLHHNLNTVHGGYETLLDDVTDPDVMALRLWARPWSFFDPGATGRRLAVGATIAGDQNAPLELVERLDGRGFEADGNGNVRVARSGPTGLLGWDVEYQLVASDRVSITPYTDVNTHLARGTGWHVGSFFGFKLTDRIVLDVRAEYRMLGARYQPAYVGRVYEAERLVYLPRRPDGVLPVPKLAWTGAHDDALRHGYYAEIGLNFADRVYLAGGWDDQTGADNNGAWAQLRVPLGETVQIGAHYVNTRFQRAAGLVDPSNMLAGAELRVSPLPWLYFDAMARRRWDLGRHGDYEPVNDWGFGTGVSFGF